MEPPLPTTDLYDNNFDSVTIKLTIHIVKKINYKDYESKKMG